MSKTSRNFKGSEAVKTHMDVKKFLGDELLASIKKVSEKRADIREALKSRGLLVEESDFLYAQTYPTTCGVDGAYIPPELRSAIGLH